MAKLILTISYPDGKSQKQELEGNNAKPLIGKKINDILDGSIIGISGVKLKITGGSDKDGFPMRSDVHGGLRANVLLSNSPGFNPKNPGHRKRKLVRGKIITEDTVQINLKVEKPV